MLISSAKRYLPCSTLLGPERFKLINQAARDALELGGFLREEAQQGQNAGKGGSRKARR
jgi:hypothetical protein